MDRVRQWSWLMSAQNAVESNSNKGPAILSHWTIGKGLSDLKYFPHTLSHTISI